MTTLASSFLIVSSLFLQIRRTTIKAWISVYFFKISLPIKELAALEHLKN